MSRDDGASLVECLAALMVLSLALMPLSEIVVGATSSWKTAESARDRLRSLQAAHFAAYEIERSTSPGEESVMPIEGGGRPLTVSRPQLEETTDCIFDLVSKRCRS